ncbi:DGQHR domain-containing protein [Vibrio chagasii]|uniref:DGQHR domain-containing protein n=1 Tax=Vibrio chagasii TaxID=170679 RepID=A0A7V7TK87_9VIBR|nr:DNA sulfur modification protein DndB [Vibrio chagasii]KAB0482362.1 DGQHR domain-containing protein [Vibrio chagasii]
MYQPITSPSNSDVELVLFKGNEGICSKGVNVYETIMTVSEFAENFEAEASSLQISAYDKRQRDLENGRAKELIHYFESRKDTVLPSVTIFVSQLRNKSEVIIGNRVMVQAQLSKISDRLVADGQNRLNLFKKLLPTHPQLSNQTIGVKLVETQTDTLEANSEVIRQLFSDYHKKLRKPNSSQNLYYDNSEPLSRLLKNQILDIETNNVQIRNLVSPNGKPTKTELMDLSSLEKFICTALGTTAKEINKELKQNPSYEQELIGISEGYLKQFFSMYNEEVIASFNDYTMLNKSIFWQGVAWLIRSMIEDSLENGTPLDWSLLNGLTTLPLHNKSDSYWQKANVVLKEDLNGKVKFKMLKGAEKACGRALCRSLRVFYSEGLDS